MGHLPALAADNILLLESCADVLGPVPADLYAAPDARCLGSCVGGHVRHCLEHYASFLDGVDAGLIDYERRARDRRLQTDRDAARQALRQTAAALARSLTFTRLDRPVRVVTSAWRRRRSVTARDRPGHRPTRRWPRDVGVATADA